MADIKTITVGATTYNIKDEVARTSLGSLNTSIGTISSSVGTIGTSVGSLNTSITNLTSSLSNKADTSSFSINGNVITLGQNKTITVATLSDGKIPSSQISFGTTSGTAFPGDSGVKNTSDIATINSTLGDLATLLDQINGD